MTVVLETTGVGAAARDAGPPPRVIHVERHGGPEETT
jgi:hypothetical protein